MMLWRHRSALNLRFQFSWWMDGNYRKAETAFMTELMPFGTTLRRALSCHVVSLIPCLFSALSSRVLWVPCLFCAVENTLLNGRVMTTRAGRMIGGLSAGGYAAIRFCMLYPQL